MRPAALKPLALVVALSTVAVIATSCRTRLLDEDGDGGTSMCATRSLVPIRLDAISPADLNVWSGALARVEITMKRLECMPLGAPLVRLDAAARTLTITARAWSPPETLPPRACTLEIPTRQVIDLGALGALPIGGLHVRDGAPDGTATFDIPVNETPTAACGQLPGGRCQLDCQCRGATPRCWPDDGNCVRSCVADGDCLAAAPFCNLGICTATGRGCAGSGEACPFGSRCDTVDGRSICRPAQNARPGARCASDAECALGGICSGCACLLPCIVDAHCPDGRRCDPDRGCL